MTRTGITSLFDWGLLVRGGWGHMGVNQIALLSRKVAEHLL